MFKQRQKVISYSPKEIVNDYSRDGAELQDSILQNWSNSLLPVDFRDRLDTL